MTLGSELSGIKYKPFLPSLPAEALWSLPGTETFVRRLETLVPHGGFVLLTGEPGYGKSKTLHLTELRLLQSSISKRPFLLLNHHLQLSIVYDTK